MNKAPSFVLVVMLSAFASRASAAPAPAPAAPASHAVDCAFKGGPFDPASNALMPVVSLGHETKTLRSNSGSEWTFDLGKAKDWKWAPGVLRVEAQSAPESFLSFDLSGDFPQRMLNAGWNSIPAKAGHEVTMIRFFFTQKVKLIARCKILK